MSLLTALLPLGAIGLMVASGFHIDLTPSLPYGLYRRVGAGPARGAIVLACLPDAAARLALTRGYVWHGDCPGGAAPVGKVVLAVQGDTISLDADGIRCNGDVAPNGRALTRDSHGRALEHYPYGVRVLGADELWLYSPYDARSYDSRYYGPVRTAAVRARLLPVMVSPRAAANASGQLCGVAGMKPRLSSADVGAGEQVSLGDRVPPIGGR